MSGWSPADEAMMAAALEEARAAEREGEIPVGAVVVRDVPDGAKVLAPEAQVIEKRDTEKRKT